MYSIEKEELIKNLIDVKKEMATNQIHKQSVRSLITKYVKHLRHNFSNDIHRDIEQIFDMLLFCITMCY